MQIAAGCKYKDIWTRCLTRPELISTTDIWLHNPTAITPADATPPTGTLESCQMAQVGHGNRTGTCVSEIICVLPPWFSVSAGRPTSILSENAVSLSMHVQQPPEFHMENKAFHTPHQSLRNMSCGLSNPIFPCPSSAWKDIVVHPHMGFLCPVDAKLDIVATPLASYPDHFLPLFFPFIPHIFHC